jgi:(2Fe-2S) ferredoxin
MVVYPGPVYYQGVSKASLDRIVQEHFVGGEPVKEYFWTGVRRRILPGQTVGKPTQTEVYPQPSSKPDELISRKPQKKVRDVDDFKW